MVTVSQSPAAVAGRRLAQPVLTPLTASAVILVMTIDRGGEPVVHNLLADLSGLARTVAFRAPHGGLAVVAGVGSAAWDRLFAGPRPAELHPFRAVEGARHRAVATPGDLLGAGEFGTYFIGYAATPSVTELMLQHMFLGDPPGNHDRILDFSTAVTGTLFFVPNADFLDDPPPSPGEG